MLTKEETRVLPLFKDTKLEGRMTDIYVNDKDLPAVRAALAKAGLGVKAQGEVPGEKEYTRTIYNVLDDVSGSLIAAMVQAHAPNITPDEEAALEEEQRAHDKAGDRRAGGRTRPPEESEFEDL